MSDERGLTELDLALGPDRAAGRGDARRACSAIDENGRTLTFAEYRDAAERAAAGLPQLGIGEGTTCRGSCRRGSSRWCSSARWRASARCRTRCCRSTASARSASSPKQTGAKLLIVPGGVARLRLRGDGARDRGRHARPRGARLRPGACPRATRRRSPPRPPSRRPGVTTDGPCAGSSTRRARPPIRRARGTPTRPSRRRRTAWSALDDDAGRPQRARVPVHAHRRDRLAVRGC